ncbi:hypothetical protein [Streptomyces sp. NPDC093261]
MASKRRPYWRTLETPTTVAAPPARQGEDRGHGSLVSRRPPVERSAR